jgi:predicted PurR-regulated permease PerM
MRYSDLQKINAILIFLIATVAVMHFGAGILIPLAFAVFLAFLLTPVSNWMERLGAHRAVSATISTLIVFIVISGILTLMATQLRGLENELPRMQERLSEVWEDLRQQLPMQDYFEADDDGGRGSDELLTFIRNAITGFLEGTLAITVKFLLVLVYLFLLLLNRHHYQRFILMYTREEDKEQTMQVIDRSADVAHHYLWGRLKVMTLLGIAYIITFLAFDVPYAILLTIFGALITIIPYIGPFVSGAAPILIMLVTGREMNTVLIFAGIIVVIQLIESYVLEPLLLSNAVQISPLSVILAVVIGGAVWGVAGMILLVPMFAIAKIFFDHVNGLKPMGYLLGLEKDGRVKRT